MTVESTEATTCPSRLKLERFLHGELDSEAHEEVRRHSESCARCARQLEAWRILERKLTCDNEVERFSAALVQRFIAEQDTSLVWGRIHRWFRRITAWVIIPRHLFALASAALVLIAIWSAILLRPLPSSTPSIGGHAVEEIIIKGDVSLKIHCRRDDQVFALDASDSIVRPGDALRFEVFSGQNSQVLILGIDAKGVVSVYAPFDGTRSLTVPPDRATVLPGSIVLDGAKTNELIMVLLAKQPIDAAKAKQAAATAFAKAGGDLGQMTNLKLTQTQQLRYLLRKSGVQQ